LARLVIISKSDGLDCEIGCVDRAVKKKGHTIAAEKLEAFFCLLVANQKRLIETFLTILAPLIP
jgi:hypothetical protein